MDDTMINIRPGVGILGLFPAMNYKAWYALAELVDNALDSYLTNRLRLRAAEGPSFQLRVAIDVESADGGRIRVWDNAGGIATRDYHRAFVTAEPPTNSAGLSQFGIGMKSASCWFAREWRVRSSALGEEVERTVEFDVPRIIREKTDTLEPVVSDAPKGEHYTEVELWNLHRPPQTQTVGKMRRHLASMYRQFLRGGDVIIEFNGEPLSYNQPPVLVEPFYNDPNGPRHTWRKDVDFRLSTGERVTGFVGIREKGSTKEAGLSLYRHGRLIMGSDDETYRPPEIFGGSNSFSYQRVFGELDLDGFRVSHTKDGFLWQDREDEFLGILRQHLDCPPLRLLQQAEGYRARKAPADMSAAATQAAAFTAAVLPQAQAVIESQATEVAREVPLPSTYGAETITSSETLVLMIKNEEWQVSIETTADPAATEWLKVRQRRTIGDVRELGILFSVSHPFTQRFGGATAEDIQGLLRVAVGLAIAETTAREAGVGMAGVVLRHLNGLLRDVLARQ